MARPCRIDPELVVKARIVVAQAADAKTLRAAQAVLMPAVAHTTLEQTAALLGVGRASVPRLQRRFREGLQLVRSSPSWGGRRRALMTTEGNYSGRFPTGGFPRGGGRGDDPRGG